MDALSARSLAAVIAAVEAESVAPPDELKGMARQMFLDFAAVNRSRAWNAAHARILAEYCRLSVMVEKEIESLEREGLTVKGAPNVRFNTLRVVNTERMRLGKFLGLSIVATGAKLGTNQQVDAGRREAAAALVEAARSDGGDLLA